MTYMKRLGFIPFGVSGLLALASCGGPTSTLHAQASGTTTTSMPDCPPTPPPPGQPACDPSQVEANRAALRAQIANQWPVTSAHPLSKDQAIAAAEQQWSPGSQGAGTRAVFTTYDHAAAMTHDDANPFVNPNTQVWVVTILAPPEGAIYRAPPPPAPSDNSQAAQQYRANPPQRPASFTVIEDAANGSTIDSCSPACY